MQVTHLPPERYGGNSLVYFAKQFYELVYWALPVNLSLEAIQIIPLMMS